MREVALLHSAVGLYLRQTQDRSLTMRLHNPPHGLLPDNQRNRLPVHLDDDRILYAYGKSNESLNLSEISHIRLSSSFNSRLHLTFQAGDGRRITLRWHPLGSQASSYFSLSGEILTRISQRNQIVTCSIGPSGCARIAGWIGLFTVCGITVGIASAALTARGLPTFTLPMALAPVALLIVMPIVMNGPKQLVELPRLISALAEHRSTSQHKNAMWMRNSND